jgi:hypothetical protein
MNFSYQKYVERMNYEPYQWPPDISLAELHSRVSEQGPVNDIGVRCPCCNFQSKKKFKGWIMRDIAEVLLAIDRTVRSTVRPSPLSSAC